MTTKKSNIVLFLFNVKTSVSKRRVEWVPRIYDGITSLGISLNTAMDILGELTPKNYYRGPSADHNGDGTDIWEFIYFIEDEGEIPVYIKIKFQDNHCKVISFHESNKPFELPYY